MIVNNHQNRSNHFSRRETYVQTHRIIKRRQSALTSSCGAAEGTLLTSFAGLHEFKLLVELLENAIVELRHCVLKLDHSEMTITMVKIKINNSTKIN